MRFSIFVLILFLFCSGCATVGGVNKSYEAVVIEDGIDKTEAVAIARKQILAEGLERAYILSFPNTQRVDDAVWSVAFLFSPLGGAQYELTFYRVRIDAATGDVLQKGVFCLQKTFWQQSPHDPNLKPYE